MNIALLLSGGVDSSVALNLLKQEGKQGITAFYIKIWLEDELSHIGECPWETDLKYAREVCKQANVPLKLLSLQTEYRELVTQNALNELRAGRTPSPDILCNQYVKFGLFYDKIDSSFDKVASGHYAQIEENAGRYFLKRSPDPVKDQTYFLCNLTQKQLSRALFPVGHLTKEEVRKIAHELRLSTRDRKDSQGICFLGQIRYPDFVKFHLGKKRGDIIESESGEKLGEHNGYWFYTIGQRQGLGLGNGPWFVTRKNVEKNIIYISHKNNLSAHVSSTFSVEDVNWITEPQQTTNLKVKIRHGPKMSNCRIEFLKGTRIKVAMKESDPGIAPGQYAIFYDGEYCLGGGAIV